MATVPATPVGESLEQRVARLLRTWRDETAYFSSTHQIVANPAYQELISLGPAALPFLFRDIEQTGDGHLTNALSAITGADPIPDEHCGRIRKIAEDWLAWAREQGYRW